MKGIQPEYTEDFLFFWDKYPSRKGAKGNKERSFHAFKHLEIVYGKGYCIKKLYEYIENCEERKVIGTCFVKQVNSFFRMLRDNNPMPEVNDIQDREWEQVRYLALKDSGGKCCLCGRGARDGVSIHVDHIKPKSKYPDLAYDLNNLQVLCGECNRGKSNIDETDWR